MDLEDVETLLMDIAVVVGARVNEMAEEAAKERALDAKAEELGARY